MSAKNQTVRPLSPELAAIAKSELKETPKKLKDGINHLREWINKQPHLKARTDDQWLAAFLRGCKHSLERAKDKIDLFYSMRSVSPDLCSFRHRHPRFKELIRTGSLLILPKLVIPTDPRAVIVRPALYDPNKFGSSDHFAMCLLILQIMCLEDDNFIVNGLTTILDLDGVTMGHFLQMPPTQVKIIVLAVQNAFPLRLKSLHILNSLPLFEKLFNVAKMFLNEKHKKRLFMHSKKDNIINKYVDEEILPREYGGKGGSAQDIIDYWIKKVDEYEGWFDEDEQYGTDESLRPGKPKPKEIMFGVQGSFRRLELD